MKLKINLISIFAIIIYDILRFKNIIIFTCFFFILTKLISTLLIKFRNIWTFILFYWKIWPRWHWLIASSAFRSDNFYRMLIWNVTCWIINITCSWYMSTFIMITFLIIMFVCPFCYRTWISFCNNIIWDILFTALFVLLDEIWNTFFHEMLFLLL